MKTYHGKAFLIEARISSLMFILCHGEHQGPNTLWAKNTGMSSCNINLAAIQDVAAKGGCGLPGPGRPAGGCDGNGVMKSNPKHATVAHSLPQLPAAVLVPAVPAEPCPELLGGAAAAPTLVLTEIPAWW